MKNSIYITAIFTAITLTGCGKATSNFGGDAASRDQDEIPLSNIAIKTNSQMLNSMAVVTAVDLQSTNGLVTNNIVNRYNSDYKFQLPNSNVLANFSGNGQLAVVKMATDFCIAMVDVTNAGGVRIFSAQALPGFDLAQTRNVFFAPANKAAFIDALMNRFWGNNIEVGPDRSTARAELNALADELILVSRNGGNEASGNTALDTRNIVKGLCVAALSAMPTSVF